MYRIVPAPKNIEIKNGDVSQATKAYEKIMNDMSDQGWKFVSMEQLSTTEVKGCLFNKTAVTTSFNILIFEK